MDNFLLMNLIESICAKQNTQGVVEVIRQCNLDALQGLTTDDESLLHIASEVGSEPVVFALLKKGMRLTPNRFGMTPMHHAAYQGHTAVLRLLVDFFPAGIEDSDHGKNTPLISASLKGNYECMRLLVTAGAKFTFNQLGRSCLHYAVNSQRPHTVSLCLDQLKSPDAIVQHITQRSIFKSENSLHLAADLVAETGEKIMKLLVIALQKIHLDATTLMGYFLLRAGDGNHVLEKAIAKGNVRLVQYLLTREPRLFDVLNQDTNSLAAFARGCAATHQGSDKQYLKRLHNIALWLEQQQQTHTALQQRQQALAGKSIEELAQAITGSAPPNKINHSKKKSRKKKTPKPATGMALLDGVAANPADTPEKPPSSQEATETLSTAAPADQQDDDPPQSLVSEVAPAIAVDATFQTIAKTPRRKEQKSRQKPYPYRKPRPFAPQSSSSNSLPRSAIVPSLPASVAVPVGFQLAHTGQHGLVKQQLPGILFQLIQLMEVKQCFLVGGAVRDLLVGHHYKYRLIPHDYDLEIFDSSFAEICQRLAAAGYVAQILGSQATKQSIRLVTQDVCIDIYANAFSGSLVERISQSASQRDLWINAAFLNMHNGHLLTPEQLTKQIQQRLLVPVVEPEQLFSEDPCRMLRILRFQKRLNFQLTQALRQQITQQASRLRPTRHSYGRLFFHLDKFFKQFVDNLWEGLQCLHDHGLLQALSANKPEFHEDRIVLPNGAHCSRVDISGRNVLSEYIKNHPQGDQRGLQRLLQSHNIQFLNQRDSSGQTPLELAMQLQNTLYLTALILAGVDTQPLQGKLMSMKNAWLTGRLLQQTLHPPPNCPKPSDSPTAAVTLS